MTRNLLWWMARGVKIAAVLPLLLGAAFLMRTDRPSEHPRTVVGSSVSTSGRMPRIDSVAGAVLHVAPFREDGRPSRVVYDPARPTGMQIDQGTPRPTLVLSGILEGRAPLAVLDGIPGREGAVVLALGDTAGGLRIRRIKEGQVTVTGMDTTWTLTVRGTP